MSKPIYLEDTFQKRTFEIKADNNPRLIGRHPECDIQTDSSDSSVSRRHLEITNTTYRGVIIKQITDKNTYLGTEENPYMQRLELDECEEVLDNHRITLGNNQYCILVRFYKCKKSELESEREKRTSDTQDPIELSLEELTS
jgi:pSer/pThr/pTyr-binding forkhead associated (FHA) protein